jgi:pimeloyl-ACP methyl ester carboxylesterase
VIRKILKFIALALAFLLVVAPSSALLYRKYLQHKVYAARAIHSPNGIDTLESVRIGGIEQWIHVRGQDVSNPILLFIHGGPGIAFIPLAGSFQQPWEQHFTVVEWDQRGAGKTYASNDRELQRRTMNVAQMEQDTLDVVNYLRGRFKRDKIIVVGHSWGSVLGLWLAHEHPDLIYAYVGVGQIVNMQQNAAAVYRDDLAEARSRHNDAAVNELESLAPYPTGTPTDLGKVFIANKWSAQLLGPQLGPGGFNDIRRLMKDLVSAPEYSLADDVGFIHGQTLSREVFAPQLTSIDLTQMGNEFRVPIFFFEGRLDPYCRPSLIWEYSESISAPHKEFVGFDRSGHFPFFEEQQEFSDKLVERVLPLAR